jgi:NAD(P)-dependent dehydrogenase (short-subunit alcohol dehydrogenase family)
MKTVLVTGATDGIGRETARQLLARGLRVLVHGRSQSKAEGQAAEFSRGPGGGQAVAVWGDLSIMRQVVALADQVRQLAPALDILINNAGVFERRRQLTAEGFERTMAVNHFAPFLLTRCLLPSIGSAPAGRVVVVSSIAHQSGQLPLDDLTFAGGYDGYEAYAASKLANILFTRALAERLKDTRVTANALHPGVIGTKLLRAGFNIGGAPVEQGARTSVYLATSAEVEGISGKYFVDCRQVTPSSTARNRALSDSLWSESERLLEAFL